MTVLIAVAVEVVVVDLPVIRSATADPRSVDSARGDDRGVVAPMDGEVREGLEAQCDVAVDGEPLTFNDENGWRLNSPSEVEILGTTCEGILDGTLSNISVTCPCGVILN